MDIHLTVAQTQRIQAVLAQGNYESVDEVVEAALSAIEQRTLPGFAGTEEELNSLLAEGLASKELTEEEFWTSVTAQTDALLEDRKVGLHS